MTQWRVAYAIEAIGEQDSPQLWEHSRTSVERSLEEGHMWVLEDQGEPVACSAFNAAIEEAVQIGGVWTLPELRRRGYGRSAVAASLLDARLEGVEQAILFTGDWRCDRARISGIRVEYGLRQGVVSRYSSQRASTELDYIARQYRQHTGCGETWVYSATT